MVYAPAEYRIAEIKKINSMQDTSTGGSGELPEGCAIELHMLEIANVRQRETSIC